MPGHSSIDTPSNRPLKLGYSKSSLLLRQIIDLHDAYSVGATVPESICRGLAGVTTSRSKGGTAVIVMTSPCFRKMATFTVGPFHQKVAGNWNVPNFDFDPSRQGFC